MALGRGMPQSKTLGRKEAKEGSQEVWPGRREGSHAWEVANWGPDAAQPQVRHKTWRPWGLLTGGRGRGPAGFRAHQRKGTSNGEHLQKDLCEGN